MGDRDIGWYVYCVVDARGLPRLNDLEAVDPAFGVEALPQGSLCAVTSPVHLAAFGEEPLKQHLEDLAWLERVARVHDAVLARLLDAGSVVPFRLFTIFTTGERVREMLDRERERLRAELDRLRGRYEWSVKVLADRERVEEAARARGAVRAGADGGAERPGHSYLARKMHDRDLHEVASDLVDAAMEQTQARLGRRAADLTLLPLQSPRISGRAGQMVLNGAFLVDRTQTDAFVAAVDELADEYRDLGLAFEVTGPWAPYNFVATEEAPG